MHVSSKRAPPLLSVVVVSLNEGSSLTSTVECLRATTGGDTEILVIDDGSDDGSADCFADGRSGVRLFRTRDLGVARARNFGADRSVGNIVVFADAHISLSPGWWAPMVDALDDPAVGAVAPAIAVDGEPDLEGFGLRFEGPDLEIEWLQKQGDAPYAVPILPGCCLAMRRDVFDATGGFDSGMIRSGGVDNELAVRLWLLGYELRVVPSVTAVHAFRDHHPYSIAWRTVVHNKLRLAFVHFARQRRARVVEALGGNPGFAQGVALTRRSDALARRRLVATHRVRDDAWFFERFGPTW